MWVKSIFYITEQTDLPYSSIRVEFSIADLNAASGADDLDDSTLFDDQATDDDIAGGQSGGAQSKAAKSEGRVPVGNDGAEEEDFDDDQPVSFPSRVNVTIEKVNHKSPAPEIKFPVLTGIIGSWRSSSIWSCCPRRDDRHWQRLLS